MKKLFKKYGEVKVSIIYKVFGTIFGTILYFVFIQDHFLLILILFPAIIGGIFCIVNNLYWFFKTLRIIKQDEEYCRSQSNEKDIFYRINSRIELAKREVEKQATELQRILEE